MRMKTPVIEDGEKGYCWYGYSATWRLASPAGQAAREAHSSLPATRALKVAPAANFGTIVRDENLGAGLRVLAFAGSALACLEGAEADQRHGIAHEQRLSTMVSMTASRAFADAALESSLRAAMASIISDLFMVSPRVGWKGPSSGRHAAFQGGCEGEPDQSCKGGNSGMELPPAKQVFSPPRGRGASLLMQAALADGSCRAADE
jgi:hypothetical protein